MGKVSICVVLSYQAWIGSFNNFVTRLGVWVPGPHNVIRCMQSQTQQLSSHYGKMFRQPQPGKFPAQQETTSNEGIQLHYAYDASLIVRHVV